ncbi:hypothetical protein KAR28_04005 [Candidatus Parcubacteria bacterium]|nr:hypothetical protein [Candidatus Parcubacteria bacterium]
MAEGEVNVAKPDDDLTEVGSQEFSYNAGDYVMSCFQKNPRKKKGAHEKQVNDT